MKISIFNLERQHRPLEPIFKKKIGEIIKQNAFILGEETEKLEKNIAHYCNTKYAVGVNSGTDALKLALIAMGIKQGDEVITTPFTFIATAEAICHVGAKPVFVDIDRRTYNINPDLIERKITRKTKAILPVHLYGLCADMDPILKIAKKYGLKILEDCAQAIGSEYKGKRAGSMGDAGAISFYPGKNLGCFGDGGMIVTDNKAIYEKIKLLRNHGSDKKYYHKKIGYNSRLDNLQAAVLNIKLLHLDRWIDSRISNAKFFNEKFKDLSISIPHIPNDCRHSFHLYVLKSKRANKIIAYLVKNKIEARTYYPMPLHLQECFRYLGYKRGDLPEAESMSRESFAIPVYPELTAREKNIIADKMIKIAKTTYR